VEAESEVQILSNGLTNRFALDAAEGAKLRADINAAQKYINNLKENIRIIDGWVSALGSLPESRLQAVAIILGSYPAGE
jgi:hypothetical protein